MFDNLWIEKYRPKTLQDIILSDDVRMTFEEYKRKQEIPHILFAGKPGTGKSSSAKIFVTDVLDSQYIYINCSDTNGIDTVRGTIANFAQTASIDGKLKIVICDEFDGFTTEGQKALRNLVEEYASNVRFIFTANHKYKVSEAIQSRCQFFSLNPPFEQILARCVYILKQENIKVSPDMKSRMLAMLKSFAPDMRKCINELQKCVVNGELIIPEKMAAAGFSHQILTSIVEGKDATDMRKYLIENESKFSNDYPSLLREMFNCVDDMDLVTDIKRKWLLIISEHLYKSAFVMDQEINAYSCLISLIK